MTPDEIKQRSAENHRPHIPSIELPPGIPDAPPELTARAQLEWFRLVRELSSQGILTKVDRGILAMYCKAWGRWAHAEDQIAETGGEIVKSPTGYPMQNPWVSVANEAGRVVLATSKELGFTPASRARIKIEPAKPVNKLAAFNARGTGTAGKIGH